MPKISVVVPVYNCEKYLFVCLDSLKQQSFTDIEIICVDDGSTDQSFMILSQYQKNDKRFKVFQQQNAGVAAARNFALQQAKGDWIAFCDADDTVPRDAYQKMYAATKDVDVVIGDFYDIDDYGAKAKIPLYAKYKNNFFYAMLKIPCVWTKLMKRSFILDNQLYFSNVILGEDVIFLAQLVTLQPKYKMVPHAVYFHWNHNKDLDKSLTHKYDFRHFQAHMYCREELLRICWQEADLQEAYYYVYHDMLGYPFEFLFRIYDTTEKEKAFQMFKDHLKKYDWSSELDRFACLIGMPYNDFMSASAQHFFATTNVLEPAESVLRRYEAGMLGFRHILKYMKAWAQYKINRKSLEHKK